PAPSGTRRPRACPPGVVVVSAHRLFRCPQMCFGPCWVPKRRPTVERVHPFLTAAVTFAAALAGSGTASALVTTRAERRGRNDERAIGDVRETQDRLRDVRRAYRLRAWRDP